MKLFDNLEMLEIESNGRVIYPVLVWDDNDAVLIDTGFPGQFDVFRAAAEKAGAPFDKINKVILTHCDLDHVGCAKLFRDAGAEIMAHESESPYICGDELSPKLARMESRHAELTDDEKAFLARVKAGAHMFHTPVEKKLRDGDTLPHCGGIKVVHTPGHTPGHICLHLFRYGVFIVGDAANIADGKLCGANPQHTLDMEMADISFEKIKSVATNNIVSYHCGYLK